jgi:hypothetical protein
MAQEYMYVCLVSMITAVVSMYSDLGVAVKTCYMDVNSYYIGISSTKYMCKMIGVHRIGTNGLLYFPGLL